MGSMSLRTLLVRVSLLGLLHSMSSLLRLVVRMSLLSVERLLGMLTSRMRFSRTRSRSRSTLSVRLRSRMMGTLLVSISLLFSRLTVLLIMMRLLGMMRSLLGTSSNYSTLVVGLLTVMLLFLLDRVLLTLLSSNVNIRSTVSRSFTSSSLGN